MQTIFFKASRQTWPSSRSHASFKTVETFTEQFVCVGPFEFSFLIIYVLTSAFVTLFIYYFSQHRILHSNASKLTYIICSRFVIFMRKAMRIGIVSGLQSECSSVSVHLLDKILDRLIWGHPSLIICLGTCGLIRVCSGWLWITLILGCLLLLLIVLLLLLFVIFMACSYFKEILPEMFSKAGGCIVTTWKH